MAITNIDGVPFIWDEQEDKNLLGSLFPDANLPSTSLTSIKIQGAKLRDAGNSVAESSPYGIGSNFSIPYKQISDNNEDIQTNTNGTISNGSNFSNFRTGHIPGGTAKTTVTKEAHTQTIWIVFKEFDNPSQIMDYLNSSMLENDLEDKEKPLKMVCAYIKLSVSNIDIIPVYKYSNGLIDWMKKMSADQLYSWITAWAGDDLELAEKNKHEGFKYYEFQLVEAYEISLPIDVRQMTKYANLSEGRKAGYDNNFRLLMSKVDNPSDPKVEATIRSLCTLLLTIDIDVINIYNRTAIDYNSLGTESLSLADIKHMIQRIKELSKKIPGFNSTKFQSGSQLVSYVNKYLVDKSGDAENTRFIIDIPFKKLTLQKRKELIYLLIEEEKLEFGGFWRQIKSENSSTVAYVTAGDVFFILLSTANEADLKNIVASLNNDNKIITLMNKTYYALLGWLCKIIGETALQSINEKAYDAKFLEATDKGNILFFDGAFLGNRQIETIDTKAQKLTFETKESPLYKSPYLAIFKNFIDKQLANDAHDLLFNKKAFDPLEMIILIPTGDEDTKVLGKIEKGQAIMLPACMVYALFREDTFEAIKIFGELAFQIGLCFVGVGALSAAIRVGRTLGIFLEATDMTLGILGATINTIPEISRNHPKFVKYTNYALLVYTIARLGYTGYKELKIGKIDLDNYDEIYRQLYTRPKGLIPKLNSIILRIRYGKNGVKLVEKVEEEWDVLQATLKSGNAKGDKVLLSAMVDKETGIISKSFHNFTDDDIQNGLHLKFLEELHPTLKKRIKLHFEIAGKNGLGLNLADPDVYKFAWKSKDIAHAEFRALDDILKKIDPTGAMGEEAIGRIMGYNSFLRKSGIQHTCADCFYLTYGVKFIK